MFCWLNVEISSGDGRIINDIQLYIIGTGTCKWTQPEAIFFPIRILMLYKYITSSHHYSTIYSYLMMRKLTIISNNNAEFFSRVGIRIPSLLPHHLRMLIICRPFLRLLDLPSSTRPQNFMPQSQIIMIWSWASFCLPSLYCRTVL